MERSTFTRIAGHLVILYLLTTAMVEMDYLVGIHKQNNPNVATFDSLRTRFATLWNVAFQMTYAVAALVIDLFALIRKDAIIPSSIKGLRYNFFDGIIFPLACGVQMFWIVYFYDSELILEKAVRCVVTSKNNFVLHAAIVLYALWELKYQPRDRPAKTRVSQTFLLAFNIVYLLTTFYTRYVDIGQWTYHVLTATAGTIMFPIIMSSITILSLIGFFLQKPLQNLLWRFEDGIYIKAQSKSRSQ